MSEVRIFKMVSGEEVLARVVTDFNGDYTFEKPRAIQVVGVQSGGLQISLIPWIITDPDCVIPVSHTNVMAEPELSVDLEKTYLAETSEIQLV